MHIKYAFNFQTLLQTSNHNVIGHFQGGHNKPNDTFLKASVLHQCLLRNDNLTLEDVDLGFSRTPLKESS